MKSSALFVLGFATLLAAAGCSKSAPQAEAPQAPIATSVEQEIIDGNRPTLDPNETHSVAVRVKVTVDRDAILNQEFLYGADLQYSSYYDKDMDLYNQSLALGHVPVRFREAGDELQLVADNRRLFPSENNHPEQLVSRFKILSRTSKTLTISSLDSRVFLGEIFSGTVDPTATSAIDPAGQPPRDLWVRSFDYARQGNYLLQQTSVILSDGSIGEFMESVFPRKTLEPGADFQKFAMDPTSDTGSMQPGDVMERFRFLPGEQIFEIGPQFTGEERKVAYGEHYDISGGKTIDWYVTRNIRDNEIQAVQQAVEGWNRYFTKFKGIQRAVVRFKGRLPEGIHIGDPRFNVINWDSRLVAGAAYESQAVDPNTGLQSHSLIYMPAAWLQIGKDYWTLGQASDLQGRASGDQKLESVSPAALRGKAVAARARIACLREVRDAAAAAASGRLSPSEIDEFATRLLKQTLFHEVGHALGLAHNFKGSLSFDRSKPGSLFSTSIMDYNDFEIERGAFSAADTADGPQLEYDRQALSAIYDKGADIAAADAVVPACNDAEADRQDQDGVDPLCIRYDIEHDPTHSVTTALDRINQASLQGDVSLAQAVKNVVGIALTDGAIAQARTQDDVDALVDKLTANLTGAIKFYLVSGKASLSRVVRTNVKSLLVFENGVLPDGYDERAMRERAFDGVQKSLALKALPAAVKAAVADAETAALAKLARTPYEQGLAAADAQALAANVRKALDGAVTGIEVAALKALRGAVLTTLARHTQVDFFLGRLGDTQRDYETAIVGLLADSATDATLSRAERVAAAGSLATYSGRRSDDAIARVTTAVTAERAAAASNAALDAAVAVLAALNGSSGG